MPRLLVFDLDEVDREGFDLELVDLKSSDLEPADLELSDLELEGVDRDEVDLEEDVEREGVDLLPSESSMEAMPLLPVVLRWDVELEAERLALEPLPEAERVTPLPRELFDLLLVLARPLDRAVVDGLLVPELLVAIGNLLSKNHIRDLFEFLNHP